MVQYKMHRSGKQQCCGTVRMHWFNLGIGCYQLGADRLLAWLIVDDDIWHLANYQFLQFIY